MSEADTKVDLNKELNEATHKILVGAEDFRVKLQLMIDTVMDSAEEEAVRLQFTMAAICMIYGASSCLKENLKRNAFKISDIVNLTNQYEKEFLSDNIDLTK